MKSKDLNRLAEVPLQDDESEVSLPIVKEIMAEHT